jgi:hypothetical protein
MAQSDSTQQSPLHRPAHGDMVDLDPALGEQLLEIALREPEPSVRAHRQGDHLRREPEALERRRRHRKGLARALVGHPATFARPNSMQQFAPGLVGAGGQGGRG